MPPHATIGERPKLASAEKFRTPHEELAYLRERVREKEEELELPKNRVEQDRIAKREVKEYAERPAETVLHENAVLAEHDIVHHVLKLEPEPHDKQVDGILKIVMEYGIRNALSVASRIKNPHLEDDVHRALIRYVAEGLPDKGMGVPEKVNRALHMVLFEIQPQAHGETQKDQAQYKLEQLLSSSEQLYAGLIGLIDEGEGYSLELAVPEGSEEAFLYLAVPYEKKSLAERLISSVFPNARISESRGDYNIFNFEGASVASYGTLATFPQLPLKTPDMFEHDPLNVLLAAFSKIAKHGEGAAMQITIGAEGDRYNHHYKKVIRELEKGKPLGMAVKIPETDIGEALRDTALGFFKSEERLKEEKEREFRKSTDQVANEEVGRKIKTRIAPASIRLVASAPTQERADEILENLEAPFSQYDNPRGNHLVFKRVGSWSMDSFLQDFTFREFEHSYTMPLSLAEITSMFHFTAERVTTSRELKRRFAKQTPAPVDMPNEGITIGLNRYGAEERPVHFAPADRSEERRVGKECRSRW